MRKIKVQDITNAVAELCEKTNLSLSHDVTERIHECAESDSSERAKGILRQIEENIRIAGEEGIPMCQDTGLACIFIELGQECILEGGFIGDAINEGVRRGYTDGYLRKSVVPDPVRRGNTGDNTPARIIYEIVTGDHVKITMAPKGFGSENMSRINMLTPAAGAEGIKDFVVDTVMQAGGRPCPPIVVGVGIGSTFDGCALLAKKALLVPFDEKNEDPFYAAMEEELLERINKLGIGPQGFGGDTTALAVKIKTAPTHIAGMPVAVNINCHVSRHASVIL
mgnify:CR=1 FL=1|jgi:hydro-lyases, Fe-S type, tartrate/fumarate subfamily, alpha region